MSERVRKIVVYCALFLAVIWGIYNFLPKSDTVPVSQSQAQAQVAVQASVAATTIEKTINIAEMKSKSWGADPFRAPALKVTRETNNTDTRWRLSGIVYNSEKPLAIINGKSVSRGQLIGNATVIEISPKSVILDHEGARVTLRVSKG